MLRTKPCDAAEAEAESTSPLSNHDYNPGMTLGYLLVAVLASGVALFALQNGTPATVRFIAWNLDGVPLAGLILGTLAAGVLIAGIPLLIQRSKARRQAVQLQTRVKELEARLAERDRTLPPPQSAAPWP
jgi:uncharacterized integral membrane protein